MKKFFSKTQEYNLRVSEEIYDKLELAVSVYNIDKSDIVRKALRKFNRIDNKELVEMLEESDSSTNSGPHRLKFIIPEKLMKGKNNSMLRHIVWWYLNLEKHTYKKTRLSVPEGLVENVHYTIQEEEKVNA